MDDRDFIYWINGMFEFGNFDTFKQEQVEQITENIIEVYDNIDKNGFVNCLESLRVISMIEGALLYYEESSIEHKVKTTNLIRNEVDEVCYRFKTEEPEERTPLIKQTYKKLPTIDKFYWDIIPIPPNMKEIPLSLEKEKSHPIFEELRKMLNGTSKSLEEEREAEAKEKIENWLKDVKKEERFWKKATKAEPVEEMGAIAETMDAPEDSVVDDDPYISSDAEKSLDAITDKIASRT